MSSFNVGNRKVGDGAPCLIVGEVAQAHEGSLTLAHSYIDAIADAGADAVKMQAHDANECGPDEPWRVEPRWKQDANRQEYWRRMSFTGEQWCGLKDHARECGLAFIVSPFSIESAWLVHGLVDAWKVASGEIGNRDLLRRLNGFRRPVIVSSGMATWDEIHEAEMYLPNVPVALLQCTSMYPCPPEQLGLSLLADRAEGSAPLGLSDHSGTIYAGLAAAALGSDIIEVHVTFSKEMQGFDTSSSITTQELRQLVEGVRFIEKAKQPVDKDALARELEPMRELFMNKWKRRVNA